MYGVTVSHYYPDGKYWCLHELANQTEIFLFYTAESNFLDLLEYNKFFDTNNFLLIL
jgi:hypothetical protein